MMLHQQGAPLLTSLYLSTYLMWVLIVAAQVQHTGVTLAPENN